MRVDNNESFLMRSLKGTPWLSEQRFCSLLSHCRITIVCCHIITAVKPALVGLSDCVSCLLGLAQTIPPLH